MVRSCIVVMAFHLRHSTLRPSADRFRITTDTECKIGCKGRRIMTEHAHPFRGNRPRTMLCKIDRELSLL